MILVTACVDETLTGFAALLAVIVATGIILGLTVVAVAEREDQHGVLAHTAIILAGLSVQYDRRTGSHRIGYALKWLTSSHLRVLSAEDRCNEHSHHWRAVPGDSTMMVNFWQPLYGTGEFDQYLHDE